MIEEGGKERETEWDQQGKPWQGSEKELHGGVKIGFSLQS